MPGGEVGRGRDDHEEARVVVVAAAGGRSWWWCQSSSRSLLLLSLRRRQSIMVCWASLLPCSTPTLHPPKGKAKSSGQQLQHGAGPSRRKSNNTAAHSSAATGSGAPPACSSTARSDFLNQQNCCPGLGQASLENGICHPRSVAKRFGQPMRFGPCPKD